MRSHELARAMLDAPDGEVICSVDISTEQDDSNARCFGAFFEGVNYLPSDVGFGSDEVSLLFSGTTNQDA